MSAVGGVSTPPDRSMAQRMEALERANEVRVWRARFRVAVKQAGKREGRARIADQLRDPHPNMETMQIGRLLLFAPRVGRRIRDEMLAAVGASPSRRVGALTDRQVRELVKQLERVA